MKTGFVLLCPLLAAASVTNVRVLGTTATQAVLAYTAPDSQSCTLTASLSSNLTPPAYDLDANLFTGANSDARAGNLGSGRMRIFVAGKRTVEKDLAGTNRSRALQADSLYYFRIACAADGSTADGTFTTATIPSGLGYGDPIPVDPANNGNYFYPSISSTDRTSSVIDPHTGALVKNMVLSGELQADTTPGMTSSGTPDMCHPKLVKVSDSNQYGYHCQLVTASGTPALYWIGTNGEVRFLGVMNVNYVPSGWNAAFYCATGMEAPFDRDDPNVFYCRVSGNDPAHGITGTNIVKATYTGHNTPGQDADSTNVARSNAGTPHTSFAALLPWARTVDVLLPEFDSNYTAFSGCCTPYGEVHYANGKIFFSYYGSQNYFAWLAVFDPAQTASMQIAKFGSAAGCIDNPAVTGTTYAGQPGCMIASTSTFTGEAMSPMRWMTLHATYATNASTYLPMTLDTLGAAGLATRYRVTIPAGLGTTGSSCTKVQPPGNPVPNWPDTSWSAGCSTITVTSEPAIYNAITGWPTTIPALPGDLLSLNSGGPGTYEALRLLDKGSDGLTWYVQRKTSRGNNVYTAISAAGTLDMMSPWVNAFAGVDTFWDYTNSGKSSSSTTALADETISPMHTAFINNAAYGRWRVVTGYAISGQEPDRILHPPPLLTLGWPGFNGSPSDIWQIGMDSHPSLPVSDPPNALTFAQVVDCHPYEGNTSIVTASNVASMGGQLYRIRGTTVASTYKLYPYFAHSGLRAMKEVSGPTVRLATDSTAQFQWCVALNAGECYGGSGAGDIYFNAPAVANTLCNYNYSRLQSGSPIPNDICVVPLTTMVQAVKMQKIAQDPFGFGARALVTSLSKYEGEADFWNARTIPDGSWVFAPLAMDGTTKLIQVPRQQTDTVNRTAYVPVSISVPSRAGVNNVIVEFGYSENGDPTGYYCTLRQEACVAQSSTINMQTPFYYLTSEFSSISGVVCQSGCTVTIPAVSGRVLYYRVDFRDAGGQVIGSQAQVQAIP